MSVDEHREQAPRSVRVYVLTVSDTRTAESDTSGQAALALCREAGHEVASYHLVKDEPAEGAALIEALCEERAADAILLNGGTGVGHWEIEVWAVSPKFSVQFSLRGSSAYRLDCIEIRKALCVGGTHI